MNRILSALAVFLLAILSGCNRAIEYAGPTCAIPDSSKVAYNTELAAAFNRIDSANFDMLKARGPKMSRHENENIEDEYEGALDVVNKAKSNIEATLMAKYCVNVDEYVVNTLQIPYRVHEFQIKPADTAIFHEAKRNQMPRE